MGDSPKAEEPPKAEEVAAPVEAATAGEDGKEEERKVRERKESKSSKDRDRDRDCDRDRDRSRDRDRDRSRDRDRDRSSRRDKDSHRDRDKDRKSSRRSRSRDRSSRRRRSRSREEPRRRRATGFDQPPADLNIPGVVMTPELAQMAVAAGIPLAGLSAAALPSQATRHARRIYVGGLPPAANEASVAKFFSTALAAVGGAETAGDSVVNVYINNEKKFAFVEFRTVGECSNGMALDGIMFEGTTLRVRRPNDYNPTIALGASTPSPDLNLAAIGLGGPTGGMGGGMGMGGMGMGGMGMGGMGGGGMGNNSENPDRIFVGGLPYMLAEPQVVQLLSQFGNIASFELVKDANGDSKGYGFAVYEDPTVVDTACARLNGMMLGDKAITVQRSQPRNDGGMGGGMATASVIQQAQQQVAMNMAMQTGVMPPGMTMPGGPPTRVVALDEMLDLNELSDQVTYDEIKEDMSDECANFGQITSLEIPRPSADGTPVPGLGKVFVEYTNLEGSVKARTTLNGRKFGGKTVKAEFFDEAKFAAKDYS